MGDRQQMFGAPGGQRPTLIRHFQQPNVNQQQQQQPLFQQHMQRNGQVVAGQQWPPVQQAATQFSNGADVNDLRGQQSDQGQMSAMGGNRSLLEHPFGQPNFQSMFQPQQGQMGNTAGNPTNQAAPFTNLQMPTGPQLHSTQRQVAAQQQNNAMQQLSQQASQMRATNLFDVNAGPQGFYDVNASDQARLFARRQNNNANFGSANPVDATAPVQPLGGNQRIIDMQQRISGLIFEINRVTTGLAEVRNHISNGPTELLRTRERELSQRLDQLTNFRQMLSKQITLGAPNSLSQRADDAQRNMLQTLSRPTSYSPATQSVGGASIGLNGPSVMPNPSAPGDTNFWSNNAAPLPSRVGQPTVPTSFQGNMTPQQMAMAEQLNRSNANNFQSMMNASSAHHVPSPLLRTQNPGQQRQLPNFAQKPFLHPFQPLNKVDFDRIHGQFCEQRHIIRDSRFLMIENRPIDLHQLHEQVMTRGGVKRVTENDLWPVIGGHLGFVTFQNSDPHQPRSAPNVSALLEQIYKRYLEDFDKLYMFQIMNTARQVAAENHAKAQESQNPPRNGSSMLSPNAVNPTNGSTIEGLGRKLPIISPAHLAQIANMTADKMANQGAASQFQMAEQNRQNLLQSRAVASTIGQNLTFAGRPTNNPQIASTLQQAQSLQRFPGAPGHNMVDGPGRLTELMRYIKEGLTQQLAALTPDKIIPNKEQFNTLMGTAIDFARQLDPKIIPLAQSSAIPVNDLKHVAYFVKIIQYQQKLSVNDPPKYILDTVVLMNMINSIWPKLQQIISIMQTSAVPPPVSQSASQPDSTNNMPSMSRPSPTASTGHKRQASASVLNSVSASPSVAASSSPMANAVSPANTSNINKADSPKPPPKGKTSKAKKAPPKRKASSAAAQSKEQIEVHPSTSTSEEVQVKTPTPTLKRAREVGHDDATIAANASTPKKSRGSWEESAVEDFAQYTSAANQANTDEEVAAFFERVQAASASQVLHLSSESDADREEVVGHLDKTFRMAGHVPMTSNQRGTRIAPSFLASRLDGDHSDADFFDWTQYDSDIERHAHTATPELQTSVSANPSPASTIGDSGPDLDEAVTGFKVTDFLSTAYLKGVKSENASLVYHYVADWPWDTDPAERVADSVWAFA